MLSEDQIKKLIELEKEEMVLINRKTECERSDNPDNAARIEIERIEIRLKEIEAEISKIKDLPKPITRDQLAVELEVSNRSEDEIIEEHTNRITNKQIEIEEQIRKYVDENDLT